MRRNSSAAHASSANGVEEAVVLTPKNVQALRTLFNIAHRLDHHLGKSWFMVLDNLNTLDRILHSPRTTTQVGCCHLPSTGLPFRIKLPDSLLFFLRFVTWICTSYRVKDLTAVTITAVLHLKV